MYTCTHLHTHVRTHALFQTFPLIPEAAPSKVKRPEHYQNHGQRRVSVQGADLDISPVAHTAHSLLPHSNQEVQEDTYLQTETTGNQSF